MIPCLPFFLLAPTATDCPAGGVGVDAWAGDDPFSSPVLSSVTVAGNGGDTCEKGGGVFVTATASEEGGGSVSGDTARTRGGYQTVPALTVSGCVIRNNTARSGGGMAVSSAPPSLLLTSRPGPPVPPESAENSSKFPDVAAAKRPVEEEASSLAGETRSSNHLERTSPNTRRGGALVGTSAEAEGSSGGGSLLSVAVNGGTVFSENRATSGGGVWASGVAVSAVGGVVVRDNVAGGLLEGCGEEVRCRIPRTLDV